MSDWQGCKSILSHKARKESRIYFRYWNQHIQESEPWKVTNFLHKEELKEFLKWKRLFLIQKNPTILMELLKWESQKDPNQSSKTLKGKNMIWTNLENILANLKDKKTLLRIFARSWEITFLTKWRRRGITSTNKATSSSAQSQKQSCAKKVSPQITMDP